MTHLSGWCSAPLGARPMCGGCKVLDCEHECHERPAVERDSASDVLAIGGAAWENGATNQDGPGDSQRELRVVVPGPRRSAGGTD